MATQGVGDRSAPGLPQRGPADRTRARHAAHHGEGTAFPGGAFQGTTALLGEVKEGVRLVACDGVCLTVTARQGLVVVEAMKMENELRAARAGTVAAVSVAEGQSVDAGAVLAVVE
mgnify:CR=1 FL=1